MLKTPVAFIIFRRPENTLRVWERIREARPEKLFLIADGPRTPEEEKECQAARDVVAHVDWPCEVHRNFSETNLGCRQRVASGLHWVFEQVEETIILEDDCLPDPSFFSFCAELLERYRNHHEVMMISGNNFSKKRLSIPDSYFFTVFAHIWGWATWRRAWQLHDDTMSDWPQFSLDKKWEECFPDTNLRAFWKQIFDRSYQGEWEWDHRWWFTCLKNGYCITPAINLVHNIGFGQSATHTKSGSDHINPAAERISFPLIHPDSIRRDFSSERQSDPTVYPEQHSLLRKHWWHGLRNWLRNFHWWKMVRNADYRRVHIELQKLQELEDHEIKSSNLILPSVSYTHGPTLATLYEEIFIRELYHFNTSKSSPRILDGGANIGLATIYWKQRFPEASVLCFEPDKAALRCLRSNLEQRHLSGVTVVEAALGCTNGFVSFDARGGASGRVSDSHKFDDSLHLVPQVRLRDYLNEPVDMLKLDVEGSETGILEDCSDCLGSVSNLYVEYHAFKDATPSLPRILTIIQNAGFEYIVESNIQRQRPLCARPDWDGITMALHLFAWKK